MSLARIVDSIEATEVENAISQSRSLLLERLGFFEQQVDAAESYVRNVFLKKEKSGVVMLPMQSGKTGAMVAIFKMLQGFVPDIEGVFICANDAVDLRVQNRRRIEPFGIKLLTRTERRKFGAELLGRHVIDFFDESHFGDRSDMTVSAFLQRIQASDSPNQIFCSISATPFGSLDGCHAAPSWPDMDALEAAGYKSVKVMFNRNELVQAEPLFTKSELCDGSVALGIDTASSIYQQVEHILARDFNDTFGLVRARRAEGDLLEQHLKERFGSKVYVRRWDQRNRDFDPQANQCTPGVFTLVIVNQKARMGNTLNTKGCEFLYECPSESAYLDTVVQALAGRACGFEKLDDHPIVYTDVAKVRAYDAFIASKGDPEALDRFGALCLDWGVKVAARAKIEEQPEYAVEVIKKTFHGNASLSKVRAWILETVCSRGLADQHGQIRTLSRITPDRSKKAAQVYDASSSACIPPGTEPGDWTAIVLDKFKDEERRKTWKGTVVKIAIRTARLNVSRKAIKASDDSLHQMFRRSA